MFFSARMLPIQRILKQKELRSPFDYGLNSSVSVTTAIVRFVLKVT